MQQFTFLVAAALTVGSFAGFGQTYQIDPAHSSAQFSVRHLMISNVKGQFKKVTGTVSFDAKNPSATSINAVIDASSVSTGDDQRDGHLKSPDFFDVAKFPAITFRGKSVEPAGDGKYNVRGDLTMHGVTKPVTLAVDGPTAEVKDPWGNYRVGAMASTKISRKEYGLVWNQALESGGVMVGDDVTITLELEFMRKPAAAAGAAKAGQP